MLLAIDVGNTNIVFGIWNGSEWSHVWRAKTDVFATEDQIAAFYFELAHQTDAPSQLSTIGCANVVPALQDTIASFGEKWLQTKVHFLTHDTVPSLRILYDPPHAVGSDRIANAVAVQAKHITPAIVVDFGTATTFDAIGVDGAYLGGSIMPGPLVSMEALAIRAAKLPKVELSAPMHAIGRDTKEALQSGFVLGYAGAIDTMIRRMRDELSQGVRVVATGGLANLFTPVCEEIQVVDEHLTLDGIRIAFGH